ncbi:MAG: tetratricopeptide repeat protein, partial [Bacteroidia bacterium]
MKKIKSLSLLFLIVYGNVLFAQLKRANKYYDNYDYVKAIQLYKRAVNKSDNTEALEKIANSYRLTKNYEKAELYYAQLMKKPNVEPVAHYYYGMVLKNNNKIDEAKEQFKQFAAASPNDKNAEQSVKSCDEVKLWVTRTQQFD